MKVRSANRSDKALIKSLYKQESKNVGSFNLFFSWDNFLLGKNSFFNVIPQVGFVRYSFLKRKKIWTLKEIAIKEEEKKKGYGLLLLNSVPKPFILKCNLENENANAFYEKNGLILIDKEKDKKGNFKNIWLRKAD